MPSMPSMPSVEHPLSESPQPVEIVSPAPIPVIITNPEGMPTPSGPVAPRVQSQLHDPSVPARTTFQEDLTTSGQRQINLIWETTQGKIALYVIMGTMVIIGMTVIASMFFGKDLTTAQAFALGYVNSLATGVVSFYFSRTNHTQIGGVGAKPSEPYQGR
jgi:hypothetical protein